VYGTTAGNADTEFRVKDSGQYHSKIILCNWREDLNIELSNNNLIIIDKLRIVLMF